MILKQRSNGRSSLSADEPDNAFGRLKRRGKPPNSHDQDRNRNSALARRATSSAN